jgi:uncharacterized protein (DUF885 family)
MKINRLMRVSMAGLAAVLCVFSPPLFADVSPAEQQLNAVMDDYWNYVLSESPLTATNAGVSDFNDRLGSVTPESNARRLDAEKLFLARTRDINRTTLSQSGLVNVELFDWVLEDSIGGYENNLARIPFNTFYGFFMAALNMANGQRMVSVEDYEDYISRMADVPRYFGENLANMEEGVRTGFVLPQIVIDGVLPTIKAQVKDEPEDSSFFDPFRNMSSKVPASEQERLKKAGARVIAEKVIPAFTEVADFLENDYKASENIGAEQLDGGKDYYAFQIKRYTTIVGTTSDEIHEIGLREVDRIKAEMMQIIEELEFDGGFDEFAEFLRTDPQFYATTPEQLLKETAYTAKRIDYVMPGFFGVLPRQSYGVVPVPDEIAPNYTTGAYSGAPLGGDHGGIYYVNTYALDQRPLFEIPSLTLHEAVPGHHHQGALSAEMEDVPDFRNNLYFSAFGEGWGLYSEKLGVEMGIYTTPYEHFGRLSYEMWRACRLVIDTGIHAKGWTRQQAMDYFAANTALAEQNIRAEVDRYISWPGQALAYKLGELRIWEMRRNAESVLGDNFDLRDFHDALLKNGALPIAMLEAVVERWIDETLLAAE